jgi:hypothetical protein
VKIVWPAQLLGDAANIGKALESLGDLSREGISLMEEGIGLSPEEWAFRIETVDRSIRETGERVAAVAPLTTMFFLEKESIGIRDPFLWKRLVEETRKTYHHLNARAKWLLDGQSSAACFSNGSLPSGEENDGPERLVAFPNVRWRSQPVRS